MTSRWQWRWEDMCGPNGLELWSEDHHDLGLCFQQICLQTPALVIFALISAFYFGSHIDYVIRSRRTLAVLTIRSTATFLLILLPILQLLLNITYANDKPIIPVEVLISATECVTWFIHLCFLTALRTRNGVCPRGPIFTRVFWSLLVVLTIISLRSHLIRYQESGSSSSILLSLVCTSVAAFLQLIYAVTMLPGQSDQQTSLLNRYEQVRSLES